MNFINIYLGIGLVVWIAMFCFYIYDVGASKSYDLIKDETGFSDGTMKMVLPLLILTTYLVWPYFVISLFSKRHK